LIRRFTRAKILFICHNAIEHESKAIDKFCTKLVLKKGDFFVVHSGEDLNNLKAFLPEANVKQNPMPTFEAFRADVMTKAEARTLLKLEEKKRVILFFGFIRPYKGLRYLLEAMPLILEQMDVHLLIVGEFWKGEEEYRKQIHDLGLENAIAIVNKYVPNEEVGIYFSASDLVVLPYTSATGSAIVQTAFSCNKPVISTDVGCLPEVINHERTGYVTPAKDAGAIAEAVVRFYKEGKEEEFVKNVIQEKETFSWGNMIETIESFPSYDGKGSSV
jgi:glycosyltransferase involved in cell wall biosynthesis